MNKIKLLGSYREEMDVLGKYLGADGLTIIEAGCGWKWPFSNPSATLIGIDTDSVAIAKRTDLATAIVGDICSADVCAVNADVVYCSFVLEHVKGADQALRNFVTWVKPGGIIIIRIPDRDTVFGFVTRLTPYWFHIAYHRWIIGSKTAGKPGFGPYPTTYEPAISRSALHQFFAANNCEIVEEYGRGNYLSQGRFLGIKKAVAISLSALSFGRLEWRHNNLGLVVRKGVNNL